jgi:hypothetical protein
MNDKMIAPLLLTGRGLLPLKKANCGVCYRESDGCYLQAVKCKAVAAARSSRPQPRIYEVPISYYGRTYEEGKKIKWWDRLRALWCIFKYNLLG